MRSFTATKPALAAFAGLSLVGALAGCAATPATDTGTTTTETTSSAPTAAATADAGSTSAYKDGSYSESADYQAPSGTETIDVTLTIANDVVTAVTVAGHATDPEAIEHQQQFADGISAEVVGKSIDQLDVHKVGGSSLTSDGFNKAVNQIKTDAAA